ncbi:hypothetical protein C8F01DRAFT_1130297 [Mycena amicta]|nr:hypothetical protein C8F01DRAFT_1130297 [Mycena amicta]
MVVRSLREGMQAVSLESKQPTTIHDLPSELLAAILLECSYGDGAPDCNTPQDEERRLAKRDMRTWACVCTHWRDIVFDTPSLWAHLAVDSRLWDDARTSVGTERVDTEQLLKLLSLSLQRSAHHPLTIHVDADTENSEFAVRLLRFFAQHSERWRDAYFRLASNSSCFLSRAHGQLGQLETLAIEYACTDDVNPPFDVFAVAPRLRSFEFTGVSKYLPQIPWGQLRHFKCTDNDFSCQWLPLLPLAELSTECDCVLDLVVFDSYTSAGNAPIVSQIPSLVLSVSAVWLYAQQVEGLLTSLLDVFFDAFTFPNLRELTLSTMTGPDVDEFTDPASWPSSLLSFHELAKRSGFHTSLVRLGIFLVISTDELFAVLELLPRLEELAIGDLSPSVSLPAGENIIITDALLESLEPRSLVPNLKMLRLTTELAFSDEQLLCLLRARASDSFSFTVEVWWLTRLLRVLDVIGFEEQVAEIEPSVRVRMGPAPKRR